MKLSAFVVVLAACSGGKSEPEKKPVTAKPPADAPPAIVIAPPPDVDTSGMHLDGDPVRHTPTNLPATLPSAHAGHQIDITLRSTPPGAQVMVDGHTVGVTPTYASLMADGAAHDFTFTLAHHALARYRFVPVTSGVIHTRLEPVVEEVNPSGEEDDGAQATPSTLVNPPPAPLAAKPVPAPAPAPAPAPTPAPAPAPTQPGSAGLGPEP